MCDPVRIVVASLKGGVGKSTTAVYLAAAAAERGHSPVLIVDADRQASSAVWLEERPVEGVEIVEAPSERTLKRAMASKDGVTIVDTPPGDERLSHSAIGEADAVVIPTRAGGVEFARVAATLDLIPGRTPRGIVVSSARIGTNDLDETINWWRKEGVPVWGVVPERVAIAAGPEARLSREGLEIYGDVLKQALKKR
jgi:chromosome partitioning protein